ncbi:hypothetical protein PAHAL_9G386600 [Panicum hallii]|uniref:Agenet domain-containing protein n=1 Tax=Panicum hallii TaxID=206008 RepID=A0A2T8I3X7_9POAL|nr:hypothetical protein PAHAL_9G386600 [Panicum hallii]
MDHDDSDFQSQNFQLVGEDSNRFPSGLRPFTLPKLDIEDQLQGHLRFDNLIDSEAFFSVQGHESNWIEVLSTGSSVVDFSSSAAESCSVSKTNNVWSEATSTESVEMLLKSVGENETTDNMDSNAHLQLSGTDSQIDQSNVHPESTNSPTDSTVVPTEKDQSQSLRAPFLMDKKAEQTTGSVAEKCIASEKLSSSNNTSGSCPAVGSYFEGVQEDLSLDKLNVPSTKVDSRNLNNEPFTGLAPLQNIYVTDSYHFEQDNKEPEVDVVPQDSKVCHFNENKVEGGLPELQSLSCAGQSLGAVNLSSQVSNETLLSESSDGLLEAITNPVKLHRSDGTCNIVNSTLQPSFSPVQHGTEGLSSSVDRSNELIVNEFGISSTSALSHRSEADSRNSNPHLVSSLSPKRKVTDATDVPEETMNAGASSTNISCTGDESKLEVLEHHKDSVDNLESGAMEEKTMEKIPVVSGNMEQMVENNHEENASGATGTSKDKVDSSDSIAPENSSADAFNASEDPTIPSINHEGSFNERDTPGIEEEPESSHLVLSTSGPHEKMSAPVISSSSGITSTTVTDTFGTPADKNGCSIGVSAADSSALPDEKDLIVSTINHEVPSKEGAKSALGDEDNNVISPGSEPGGVMSAVPADSNIDVYGSTVSVAKKEEYKEQANSLGGLPTGEAQDKSGNHPDGSSPKCQTDRSSVRCEHHTDPATPPALGISSGKVAEKVVETPQTASNDLNAHVQDAVLNHGTNHSPGTVTSQGKVGSSIVESGNGNGICTSATCGSPLVISCSEPSPQEGGQGSSALLHHTLDGQSGDPKDCEASADAAQSSKQCSTRNVESASGSEETNTAGGDRSFSFEVGAPPNASEKAHSPVWSPFPRYKASQSTEITPGNPQPGSSLKSISDDSKETSIAKAGKEQLSERKLAESAGGPSDNSNIGDGTKSNSSPPEQSQQQPTPDCSDLVNFPFTDPQHLQLRAQIFVYGALIQGTPPGEAYMVAAFGESGGGGKPTWEAAWRAALERFQYQKSLYTGLETPTSSRIGSSVPEKASKGTTVRTAPASKKGGKTVVPAHSTATLHSPTFNVPLGSSTFNLQRGTHLDFSQAVSPFTYNSHMRQPSPGVAPWYTQSPGPRSAPWLIPPQNLIFDSSMQPAGPTNETAKGASSKNISISHTVSPVLVPPSPAPSIVSSPAAVVNDEKQKVPASSSKHGTASQKPRKRKKASASPEQQSVTASPQLKTDVTSSTPATKHTSGFTLSTHSPSNALVSRVVPNTGQITSLPNYQITGGMDSEQRIIFSEQIRGAIEQSTGQAKGASMHSVEAVRHKEGIWSHLSTISRNKLPREVEEKLTSAAAAAEAAVSVAKAAAEAAKMASEAALQAKMMAEEALSSSTSLKSMHHEAGEFNISSNPPGLSSSTAASSLKIKDNSRTPGSIISVAREAARKRVEEASAAAKRAENLDAILKAAELAAEAVFRAGTIIGMGEPLPFTLRELLEAGPDGYWKSESVRNKAGSGNHNPVTETLEVDAPANFSKSGRKRGRKPKYDQALPNLEPSSSGKELQPEGIHSANLGHGVEDVPTTMALDGNRNSTAPISIIWNGIEKGSAVEVLSDKGGFGVAWFSAKVVDINENNAFVSYDNHNGTGPHEERVPLIPDGDKPPQIRLPYPATLTKFKTRKRRRETAGSCLWVIGDHVDAWVNDSWREGVIAQNYEGDETKYVVHFSVGGGGESLVVDSWNLRPSRVWKDGQWTEWSRARERKSKSNKGDSPLEKRQRTDLLQAGGDLSIVGEAGGPSKDKNTNNTKKPEDLKPLGLSQREMVFNVGKSVVENKSDALAFKRPGLQKEGSKVVYGVPKHGKKKKFMEVSKHYDAGQSDKISEGNSSSRFAKHSMPQLPRPRENTSKVDHNRGRRVAEMRSRIPKPTKSQNVAANSVHDKDSLPMSVPNSGVSERSFTFAGSTTSTSNTQKPTVEKNNSALGTSLRTEVPSVSEMQAASTDPTSKQNVSTNNRAKRKYVPAVGNVNRGTLRTSEKTSSDSGEPQRTSSDSAEPRRSNRRIQPTSRLLEGLQSSLIISKVPGEKVPRSNYKSASSRGRAHG